jgi:hypothetical protein
MKRSVTIVFWIILVFVLLYLSLVISVGNSAVDLQLHDTYFVIAPFHLRFAIAGLLIFIALLASAIYSRFNKVAINLSLLLVIFAFILGLTMISSSLAYVLQSPIWSSLSVAIVWVQAVSLLLFFFVSFKTAIAFKRNNQ